MKEICRNKRAYFDYFIEKTYVAGVELKGSEVKSMRLNNCSINETFATINNDEVFLKNCFIKNYDKSTIDTPDERRKIKLLLNKEEIAKIKKQIEIKGYSLIATKMFFDNKNYVKCEIAIARGKKLYDKRETIKLRDEERQARKIL